MSVLFEGSVPTYALDTVRERVAKVNARANRRGFPTVTLTVGATSLVSDPYFECSCPWAQAVRDGMMTCDETVPQVEYSDVRITADAPLRMSGWRLVAVVAADAVDTDGNAVPMLTNVPGESSRGIEITDAMLCNHCNTRRYRTETFIVRHDDGRISQVGRQCIRDFLGHDPAALLAGLDAFRSLVFSDSERESWGRAAPRTWSIREVLTAAARIVAADGWYISKRKAEESEGTERQVNSTASRVGLVLNPFNAQQRKHVDEDYPHTDRVDWLVDTTISELASLRPSNEWEYKLADYANIATVGARHLGILASALILALRTEERKQKAAAKPESHHIGSIGERLTLTVQVNFVREFDGNYGTTTLLKGTTPEGNAVQWWRTGAWARAYETDHGPETWTGTVKAHDLDRFDNSPVTVLTRCKVG